MATKTPATNKPLKKYRVMIPVANDETGKRFQVGDTVTTNDFSPDVINSWLTTIPPVMIAIEPTVAIDTPKGGE